MLALDLSMFKKIKIGGKTMKRLELDGKLVWERITNLVTVGIQLTDGIRVGSDGTDRTQSGYCATAHIDLTSIPKPCTIHLLDAKWAYATASESGPIMYYAARADGTKLDGGSTSDTIGKGHFTVVRNGGSNTDVTVTVTSNEVAKIRFSGNWQHKELEGKYPDWNEVMHATAILTYPVN